MQGYRQRGAYIATQTPMENTMSDFWRMIWEYKNRSIVVVNEEVSKRVIEIESYYKSSLISPCSSFRKPTMPTYQETKGSMKSMGQCQ